jgi:hypothetical protein
VVARITPPNPNYKNSRIYFWAGEIVLAFARNVQYTSSVSRTSVQNVRAQDVPRLEILKGTPMQDERLYERQLETGWAEDCFHSSPACLNCREGDNEDLEDEEAAA